MDGWTHQSHVFLSTCFQEGTVYVDAAGDDVSNNGTQGAPVASLARAVEVVVDDGLIVVRRRL